MVRALLRPSVAHMALEFMPRGAGRLRLELSTWRWGALSLVRPDGLGHWSLRGACFPFSLGPRARPAPLVSSLPRSERGEVGSVCLPLAAGSPPRSELRLAAGAPRGIELVVQALRRHFQQKGAPRPPSRSGRRRESSARKPPNSPLANAFRTSAPRSSSARAGAEASACRPTTDRSRDGLVRRAIRREVGRPSFWDRQQPVHSRDKDIQMHGDAVVCEFVAGSRSRAFPQKLNICKRGPLMPQTRSDSVSS